MAVALVLFVLKIALILLLVIAIVVIFTKKGRMFAKAAYNSFFTEANKNPKIVAEYFDEKISQLQKSYAKADDAYRKASGEKLVNDKKIKELEKQLSQTNRYALEAKKRGDIDDARMYAKEAMGIQSELEAKKENIPVFEEAMRSASDLRERAKEAIHDLEIRKKTDIAKAERGKAAQEIYSQFDESRISSDIDRVLNQFSDYAEDQEKMGLGAKASWDTSYEAKQISAEKRAREYQADDYLNSLINSMSEEK